ncbi:MAG: hypothetical protein NTZ17_00205 [Phycisphaerae bacterium]|nr:hypothetical protein [Phycisphaerae bacterium]
METVQFDKAYYIKLGRGGKWEKSAIAENKLRIGWTHQSLDDINNARWEEIHAQLAQTAADGGVATRDLNALRMICESTPNDVWITFSGSKLWWCRVGAPLIEEDGVSKFRRLNAAWKDHDIHGAVLFVNQIPGNLARTQGFRGTACEVRERDTLHRLLNDEASPEYRNVAKARDALVKAAEAGIRRLHWRDFETFVDLLFRQSGWRRLTTVGKTMKYSDLELEDPITRDQYQVQVKSAADLPEFRRYADQFAAGDYRKLYFVVHTPTEALTTTPVTNADVELLLPGRLAEMAIDLGLVNWLLHKLK